MARRTILSDEELATGAKALADDLRIGETRRLKLAKVIDDHLAWFDLARARGLEWTDIIDLLFQAGVTRPDGRPLSRGHLSSLVWRKLQSSDVGAPAQATAQARLAEPQELGRKRSTVAGMTKPEEAVSESVVTASPTLTLKPAKQNKTKPVDGDGKSSDRDKLIAFMRRSARVRRDE